MKSLYSLLAVAAVGLLLSLTSCSSVNKSFKTNVATHDTSAHVEAKVQQSQIVDSNKTSHVDESAFIAKEDESFQVTVIEELDTSGRITKRTTSKEKTKAKTTEQKQKTTEETKTFQSDTKTVAEKKKDTTSTTVNVETTRAKSKFTTLTGLWLSLLLLLLLYLVYRKLKYGKWLW